jgi:hypothetical protein
MIDGVEFTWTRLDAMIRTYNAFVMDVSGMLFFGCSGG